MVMILDGATDGIDNAITEKKNTTKPVENDQKHAENG